MTVLIVILCGLIIALAVYFLIRSVRRMVKGQCCEGCGSCPRRDDCSGAPPDDQNTRKGSGAP